MKLIFTSICVLVIGATLTAFGPNYNASKSNNGSVVLAYSPERVTAAQANAILAELEKLTAAPDEAALRQILKRQGVQADGIQKIVVTGTTGYPGTLKGYGILLLEQPDDLKAALQVSQHVTSAPARK